MSEPVDCGRCAQLEELVRRYENDLADLGAQLAGVQMQARRAGQSEVAVRRMLREAQEADPKSEQIREVLNHWQAFHPKAKTPTGGKRFLVVKKALRLGFDVEQLKEALDGLRAYPFVGPQGRTDRPAGGGRYDDVEHALRDEETIERFIGYLTTPPPAVAKTRSADQAPQKPPLTACAAIERVLGRLEGVKPAGLGQWTARCPAHDDRNASLSVAQGREKVIAHCHAGCTVDEIAAAIDVPIGEWFDHEPTLAARPAVKSPDPLPTMSTLKLWQDRLANNAKLAERMGVLKGWTLEAMVALGLGWDGERIVMPVTDAQGELVNLCRYRPGGKPKMLGLRHRERQLFPAVETIPGDVVWLLEGEPDAVTARSIGVPAVALPGVNGWRDEWAPRFAGRRVIVCMDADAPGRKAASHVRQALPDAVVVDLCESRADGYDFTDHVQAGLDPWVLVGGVERRDAA